MAKVKKTVIINKKMYKMPGWSFRDIRKLEASGLDMTKIQNPQQNLFTSLSAFVAVTANVDIDEADALVEAHVDDGGDVRDLLTDFYNSLGASPFFSKMMENMAKETPKNQNQEAESESENS